VSVCERERVFVWVCLCVLASQLKWLEEGVIYQVERVCVCTCVCVCMYWQASSSGWSDLYIR